jgi:hypothetical protein
LTIRVQNEPLVTAQQAAALDTMQRGLDNLPPIVQTVGDLHCGLSIMATQEILFIQFPETVPVPPQLGSVSQSVLTRYPEYQEAYNATATAVNESRRLAGLWNDRCDLLMEAFFSSDEARIAEIYAIVDAMQADINTAANNVVTAYNDALNRITILRNPPQ